VTHRHIFEISTKTAAKQVPLIWTFIPDHQQRKQHRTRQTERNTQLPEQRIHVQGILYQAQRMFVRDESVGRDQGKEKRFFGTCYSQVVRANQRQLT